MTKTAKKKFSAHNQKRADRFAAKGITVADMAVARTAYEGDEGGSCCLCDTPIKHRFTLTFAGRPDGKPDVIFEPVGSQCITDWMRALPSCPEVDAALANVKEAERARDRAVAEKKRQERRKAERAAALEEMDEDTAGLMRRFYAVEDHPALARMTEKDRDALLDIAARVERDYEFRSDRQARYFAVLVREAVTVVRRALPAGEREALVLACVDEDARDLMERYYALPERARCATLIDMANGVEEWGKFRSPKAARFFAVKLKEAEKVAERIEAEEADADAQSAPAATEAALPDPLEGRATATTAKDFPLL